MTLARKWADALGAGLVLATHNPGKLAEMRDLVAPWGVAVDSAGELGLPEPEETGDTFVANARLKARAAADLSGKPSIGDDSGLVVPALDGAPGIHSARWAGPERDFGMAMAKLHQRVAASDGDDERKWRAHFISVVVLQLTEVAGTAGAGEEIVVDGRVDGTLVWPPRGPNGFGYDPMFVPDGDARTFGEMPGADKAHYSHRAIALRRLLDRLTGD